MEKLLVKNGTVVTAQAARPADVMICGETIKEMASGLTADEGTTVIDCTGMYVFPGMIDSHVHFYAPAGEGYTADDFTSGSLCALHGGMTTIVDYSFPRSGMDLRGALRTRMKEAAGYSCVDYSFHVEMMGWYPYDPAELILLHGQGVNSLKLYTTYGSDQMTLDQIGTLMKYAAKAGLRVTIHAEDDKICMREKAALIQRGQTGFCYHAKSRPPEAEARAIRDLMVLAEETGAQTHIVHVSTAEGIRAIAQAKSRGVMVTCETCPHYLLLQDDCYCGERGAEFIMTPPLRSKEDSEALWEHLLNGTIDSIVSDHCAFTRKEKGAAQTCFATPPGIPGTETIFPLIYTYGRRRGLELTKMAALMSGRPAELFGLYPQKGSIAPGCDADLVVVNPGYRGRLSAAQLHSRAGYSPYEGTEVACAIEHVIRRGKIMIQDKKDINIAKDGKFISCKPAS